MRVILNKHLERLRAIEVLKDGGNPANVPSYKELAEATGLDYQTVYRFAENKAPKARLNIDTVGRIITVLRKRGYNTDVSDILVYEEGDTKELTVA